MRRSDLGVIAASALLVLGLLPVAATVHAQTAGTDANVPFVPVVPRLELPIPTLPSFSNIQVQSEGGNRSLDVPFIADYVVAIYRYAIGIIVTLAMVMVVVGGLRWTTAAGNSTTISAAKETITRAVMGLLIALGSYAILYAINPELVNFRSIRVDLVNRVNVDQILSTTTEITLPTGGDEGCDSSSDGYAPPAAAPAASVSSCPVSLTSSYAEDSRRPERTQQFMTAMPSAVHAATARSRVVQIAAAATACQLFMGSCGNTVQTLNDVAGVPGLGARVTHEIGADRTRYLISVNTCPSGDRDCTRRIKCAVYARFLSEIPGWPDDWARGLQPGDAFYVFNGNSSAGGQHSAIFMGWAGGGRAYVVQGGRGQSSNMVRTGRICITSACGGLLTKTFSAD